METAEQNKTRAANIRAVWDALLAPKWDKDVLIALGKCLYARRPLKELDADFFDRLLPLLVEIVEVLDAKFKPPVPESPPTVAEGSPGVKGAAGPGPCPTGPAGVKGPTGCTTGPDGPAVTTKPATNKPSHGPAVLHAKERPIVPPLATPEPMNSEDMMADATPARKE
jgi:hypothetical protein